MWIKNLVQLLMVLCLIVFTSQSEDVAYESVNSTELSSKLPNIWEDEVVTRMIRDVLVRDLVKGVEHKRMKRQHKRDVYSTVSPVVMTKAQTTRKASATTQRAKKPTKVAQTGNKTKNRVTSSPSTSIKATVKPSTKPIVTNSSSIGVNSSKVKVRKKNNRQR